MGLAVLVMGVFWFNYTKYKKVAAGEIKPSKSANLEPWKEDAPDVVSTGIHLFFMQEQHLRLTVAQTGYQDTCSNGLCPQVQECLVLQGLQARQCILLRCSYCAI